MLNVTARQELLSRIADTISIVVEEARFDFSENGLNIRVVDPSHVAMVKLDVDAVAFETWEVEEAMVGLEMKKLKELISLGAADDIISMTYDGKGDVLMNLGKIDRSSRPLDNNTLNPPNLPNLDLPCSVTIRGSELAQAFRAARQVGDLVTLSVPGEVHHPRLGTQRFGDGRVWARRTAGHHLRQSGEVAVQPHLPRATWQGVQQHRKCDHRVRGELPTGHGFHLQRRQRFGQVFPGSTC